MSDPDVRLERVVKRFDDVVAVDGISVEIPAGSFFALLGPSGCGKTTTLRMIGGFEEPDEGAIYLGEEDVVGLPPYRRDVNTVFQSYALFPHLSVFENVAFGLRRKRIDKQQVKGRVDEMLRLVGLEGLGPRRPRQLSGGQQQRVALARALVNRPQVLLLDEPLGALDLKLRKQMQLELKQIQHDLGLTFVHVTHDQEEAMTMADQIAVMNKGRIEQLGPPDELYEHPATAFVAGFLGVSNLLTGTVSGSGRVRLDTGDEIAAGTDDRSGRVAVGHPAREDPARASGRGRQQARRHDRRDRLRRRRDAVRRPHGRRHDQRLRPERRCRRRAPPGCRDHTELEPERHVRRRPATGGDHMTRPLTRRELLERAALGGAVLTVPGFLAACGGSGGIEGTATTGAGTTAAGGGKTLADKLTISNWTLYIDIDEDTKKYPTLEQFTAETGVKVDYIEDVNDNDEWFGKNQAALAKGQPVGRDITVLTDWMAARMVRLGYVEKLDKDAIPNASNLVDALASPGWDPNREYSLPWQSGMTGIGYDPSKVGGELTSLTQLLEDPKLKGKVTFLTEMPDTMGLMILRRRRRPDQGRQGRLRQGDQAPAAGRRLRSDPPVHRQRLLGPAREGRHLGGRRLVGRHGAADRRQPEPEVHAPRGGRDDLDRQHDDPEGRRRLHGLDVHELRLRPEGRGADRGVRQLHLPGRGRRRRRSRRSTPSSPTTS